MAELVGGTATEAWVVALTRPLQGVGAGTVNPRIPGIFQELFRGRERARAPAATVGSITGVIGPLVGGTVIGAAGEQHGWRWVLLLNLPFGLITVPPAGKWLPATARRAGPRATLDLVGLGLLATVTVGLPAPFVLPDGGPDWLLVAAAVLLALIGDRGGGAHRHRRRSLPAGGGPGAAHLRRHAGAATASAACDVRSPAAAPQPAGQL